MLRSIDKNEQSAQIDNRIIHFIEIMSRSPLNSAWHHFALLMEDRTDTFREKGDVKKSRKFQVYYRHRLTYEGHLCWSYPTAVKNGKKAELSVRFDKIRRGEQIDLLQDGLHYAVNLMEYLNMKKQAFHIDTMALPSNLESGDLSRIEMILEKWGLRRPVTLKLEEPDPEQMELFTNRLISSAVLVKAAEQRRSHYTAASS
ncbi:hypothetical protein C6Y45_05915 [Alkalicoccus saliphilus]|uniref:Uncharacterized protein n=2 Tax=Alkalicoccus saliphilus TaxID=200989 RepID=A0A2T4U866_9BACI|nr:hypothetical protein C6Y45_05915 [Alkalicoccus saliphilus]